jgi:hypothetical protein
MSDLKVDGIIASTGTNTALTLQGKGSGKVAIGDGALLFPDADGSDGQFIKTDGSAALSFAAAGGGWTFVETQTWSADGTLTFAHTVEVGYDYFVQQRDILNSADIAIADAVAVQFGTGGGPTFLTTGYKSQGIRTQSTTLDSVANEITDGIPLWVASTLGGAAGETWSAECLCLNPGASDEVDVKMWSHMENSAGNHCSSWLTGRLENTTAITGIRIDYTGAQTGTTGEATLFKLKVTA